MERAEAAGALAQSQQAERCNTKIAGASRPSSPHPTAPLAATGCGAVAGPNTSPASSSGGAGPTGCWRSTRAAAKAVATVAATRLFTEAAAAVEDDWRGVLRLTRQGWVAPEDVAAKLCQGLATEGAVTPQQVSDAVAGAGPVAAAALPGPACTASLIVKHPTLPLLRRRMPMCKVSVQYVKHRSILFTAASPVAAEGQGTATPPAALHPATVLAWLEAAVASPEGASSAPSLRVCDVVQLVRSVFTPLDGGAAVPAPAVAAAVHAAAGSPAMPPASSNLIHETATLRKFYEEVLAPPHPLSEEDEGAGGSEEAGTGDAGSSPAPEHHLPAAATYPEGTPVSPAPAVPWQPYTVVVCTTSAAAAALHQVLQAAATGSAAPSPYAIKSALPSMACLTALVTGCPGGPAAVAAGSSATQGDAIPAEEAMALTKASEVLPRGKRITPVVVAAPAPAAASEAASTTAASATGDAAPAASELSSALAPKATVLVPATAMVATPSATSKYLEALESAVSAGTVALASSELATGIGGAHAEAVSRARHAATGQTAGRIPPSPPRRAGGWGSPSFAASASSGSDSFSSSLLRPTLAAASGNSATEPLGAGAKKAPRYASAALSPALASQNWRAPRAVPALPATPAAPAITGAASATVSLAVHAAAQQPLLPHLPPAMAALGSAFVVGGDEGEGSAAHALAEAAAVPAAAVAAAAECQIDVSLLPSAVLSAPGSPSSTTSSIALPPAPPPSRSSDVDCHTTRSEGSGGSRMEEPPAAAAAAGPAPLPPLPALLAPVAAPTAAATRPKEQHAKQQQAHKQPRRSPLVKQLPGTHPQQRQSLHRRPYGPGPLSSPLHPHHHHYYPYHEHDGGGAGAWGSAPPHAYAAPPHAPQAHQLGSGGPLPVGYPMHLLPSLPGGAGYLHPTQGSCWYPAPGELPANQHHVYAPVLPQPPAPEAVPAPLLPSGKVWLSVDAAEAMAYLVDPTRLKGSEQQRAYLQSQQQLYYVAPLPAAVSGGDGEGHSAPLLPAVEALEGAGMGRPRAISPVPPRPRRPHTGSYNTGAHAKPRHQPRGGLPKTAAADRADNSQHTHKRRHPPPAAAAGSGAPGAALPASAATVLPKRRLSAAAAPYLPSF